MNRRMCLSTQGLSVSPRRQFPSCDETLKRIRIPHRRGRKTLAQTIQNRTYGLPYRICQTFLSREYGSGSSAEYRFAPSSGATHRHTASHTAGSRERFIPLYDGIREHLKRTGIEYIDLTRCLNSFDDEDVWILPLDQHPNHQAHRVFTDRLFAEIPNLLAVRLRDTGRPDDRTEEFAIMRK